MKSQYVNLQLAQVNSGLSLRRTGILINRLIVAVLSKLKQNRKSNDYDAVQKRCSQKLTKYKLTLYGIRSKNLNDIFCAK